LKKNKLNTKYIDGLAEKYRKNPTEKNKKAWYIAINQWSERHKLKYTDSKKGQTVLVI
jgi:hypothetical protein|tara:strand:+ start:509 stop:682 length:174 start_codon:yes stop_codon:yes gene_type:complete